MQGAARPTNNRNGGSILVRLLAVIFECTPSNIRALSRDNDVRDSRIYALAFSFLEVAAQRSASSRLTSSANEMEGPTYARGYLSSHTSSKRQLL